MRPADVVLTHRALARYCERARPDLTEQEARAELRQRARRGRVRHRGPSWLAPMKRLTNAAGVLVLDGEPVAVLPLVRNVETGDTVATTVKTPG
jgi:hypothetical protein